MSQILYALVVLQGTTLNFSPGYTTAAECLQQYKGPNVACFAYDAGLSTWTAFFKLPEGGFRTVGKIASEDECKRYIGAFKDGIPTACRQLAMPVTVYEPFDMKLCRVPLLDLVEVAAISVLRVGGFAAAELGEFLRKLVFVFDSTWDRSLCRNGDRSHQREIH
jgi:hypothetical protein